MFSWGARTAAFLGAILTVFAGVVVSKSLKSSVREKKKCPAAKCEERAGGLRAGRIGKCDRKLAKSHSAGFPPLLSLPLPRRGLLNRVRALPLFFLLHIIHKRLVYSSSSSALLTTITTPSSDNAHHRANRLSLAQSAYAEREARQSSKWATQWWASSEWVTWERCTPGGSPTQDGGRCKVSLESACTVSQQLWYVPLPLQHPSPCILMT